MMSDRKKRQIGDLFCEFKIYLIPRGGWKAAIDSSVQFQKITYRRICVVENHTPCSRKKSICKCKPNLLLPIADDITDIDRIEPAAILKNTQK
jgi:hypothetical protein